MNYKIKHVLENLPSSPGVYFMKDSTGKIIYIGKAKNLKNRVSSYFINNKKNLKTQLLVSNIDSVEYVLASSEEDAFSLESNLIKENQPKYNILLKDDKLFPYIKIDKSKPFPDIEVVRRVKKDGALYFGPFVTGLRVSEIVSIIKSVYKVRQCKIDFTKNRKRTRMCLFGDMGKCAGPCVGNITNEEYLKIIDEVIDFLNGKNRKVKQLLTDKMNECVKNEDYEQAIVYRDQLQMLEKSDSYILSNLAKDENIDTFAIGEQDGIICLNINSIRNGKTIKDQNIILDTIDETKAEMLENYILQYYEHNLIPEQILTNIEVSDKLSDLIKDMYGKRVEIKVPKTGTKKKIVQMAELNTKEKLDKNLTLIKVKEAMTKGGLVELAEVLNLVKVPDRIECYDISNISGTDSVASMVVFVGGVPQKREYRKFKIKTVVGADDFASLSETLSRRLTRLKNGDEKFSAPDLFVIDGGLGQLNAVKKVLDEFNMDIPVVSLAKKEEEIFVTGRQTSIKLNERSNARKLLIRLRDEAHRFAIEFHRDTRDKNFFKK